MRTRKPGSPWGLTTNSKPTSSSWCGDLVPPTHMIWYDMEWCGDLGPPESGHSKAGSHSLSLLLRHCRPAKYNPTDLRKEALPATHRPLWSIHSQVRCSPTSTSNLARKYFKCNVHKCDLSSLQYHQLVSDGITGYINNALLHSQLTQFGQWRHLFSPVTCNLLEFNTFWNKQLINLHL